MTEFPKEKFIKLRHAYRGMGFIPEVSHKKYEIREEGMLKDFPVELKEFTAFLVYSICISAATAVSIPRGTFVRTDCGIPS